MSEKMNPQSQPNIQEDLGFKTKSKKPRLYKVIILNDDFTPMDFVIDVLTGFFNKTEEEAARIMLEVHHKGSGIAGVYSKDIAETKVLQVNQYAKENQHPLKTISEPE